MTSLLLTVGGFLNVGLTLAVVVVHVGSILRGCLPARSATPVAASSSAVGLLFCALCGPLHDVATRGWPGLLLLLAEVCATVGAVARLRWSQVDVSRNCPQLAKHQNWWHRAGVKA